MTAVILTVELSHPLQRKGWILPVLLSQCVACGLVLFCACAEIPAWGRDFAMAGGDLSGTLHQGL